MSKTVKLQGEGFESVELPVLTGTLGNEVVDIRAFTKGTNMFTFDPSLKLHLLMVIKVCCITAAIPLNN